MDRADRPGKGSGPQYGKRFAVGHRSHPLNDIRSTKDRNLSAQSLGRFFLVEDGFQFSDGGVLAYLFNGSQLGS